MGLVGVGGIGWVWAGLGGVGWVGRGGAWWDWVWVGCYAANMMEVGVDLIGLKRFWLVCLGWGEVELRWTAVGWAAVG